MMVMGQKFKAVIATVSLLTGIGISILGFMVIALSSAWGGSPSSHDLLVGGGYVSAGLITFIFYALFARTRKGHYFLLTMLPFVLLLIALVQYLLR